MTKRLTQRTRHFNGEFPLPVENLRRAAAVPENFSEIRWLQIELFHAELSYRSCEWLSVGRLIPTKISDRSPAKFIAQTRE
jgi:hypothetical protein